MRAPFSKSPQPPRLVPRQLQEFLTTEAFGGLLLLLVAAAALAWANVFPGSYDRLWHTTVTASFGRWHVTEDLRHWINDGAMVLFFFVVGLEVKRELVSGELRRPSVAAFPIAGAIGGMVVPALVFWGFNVGTPGVRGWGIPMATDVAFAVGLLALFGRGLPSGLRLFLLTLAIVDDLGAILVIAIFYSRSIEPVALLVALGLLVLMALLRRMQVRAGGIYLLIGIGVWLAVFESGVHATIAGVALAFVTPAIAIQRPKTVSSEARRIADATSDDPKPLDVDADLWLDLSALSRDAVSPLSRIVRALHPWTSFLIVPLFALANAGVRIGGEGTKGAVTSRVALGVIAGLVLGKALGITLGAAAVTKLRIARLPDEVTWSQVGAVAALGGIGFTVSLFIAGLAFGEKGLLEAKLGILIGSIVSGVIGGVLLLRARRASEDKVVSENPTHKNVPTISNLDATEHERR